MIQPFMARVLEHAEAGRIAGTQRRRLLPGWSVDRHRRSPTVSFACGMLDG